MKKSLYGRTVFSSNLGEYEKTGLEGLLFHMDDDDLFYDELEDDNGDMIK